MSLKPIKLLFCLIIITAFATSCSSGTPAQRQFDLEQEARDALDNLYRHTPGARQLASGAKGVLVFPGITKAGFIFGGQYGKGVLFDHGRIEGHYRTTSASYGLQAGVQTFAYAMFFMSESDLEYLNKSEGWEVGVGPTLTVADKGFANSITTTTAQKGIYVFFFEQKGLMAGLGIQGTKITKID